MSFSKEHKYLKTLSISWSVSHSPSLQYQEIHINTHYLSFTVMTRGMNQTELQLRSRTDISIT